MYHLTLSSYVYLYHLCCFNFHVHRVFVPITVPLAVHSSVQLETLCGPFELSHRQRCHPSAGLGVNSSLVKLSKNTWWFFPLRRHVRSFTTLCPSCFFPLPSFRCTLVRYGNSCQQVPTPLSPMLCVGAYPGFKVEGATVGAREARAQKFTPRQLITRKFEVRSIAINTLRS